MLDVDSDMEAEMVPASGFCINAFLNWEPHIFILYWHYKLCRQLWMVPLPGPGARGGGIDRERLTQMLDIWVLNASRTSRDDVKQITGNAYLEPQTEAEARGRALERAHVSKRNVM